MRLQVLFGSQSILWFLIRGYAFRGHFKFIAVSYQDGADVFVKTLWAPSCIDIWETFLNN